MIMLRYKKTLDIVEKFMIDSRIREYCTKICKGYCCGSCYKKNEQACHRHEKRRLPCSIYLCIDLYERFSKEDDQILSKVKSIILEECRRLTRNNVYFSVPSRKFFRQSRFPSDIICRLDEDMAKRVNIIMTKLINDKTDIKHHTSMNDITLTSARSSTR